MACSIVTVRFVTGGVETQTQRKHSANAKQSHMHNRNATHNAGTHLP